MDALLREIVTNAGHAEAAEAARLIVRLEANPDDREARQLAQGLIDAYRTERRPGR